MIFRRSLPERNYRDYTQFRPLLRRDFHYRCAYCLIQEFFLGGEAGFEIDHYCPIHGPYGRPDLIADYTNLYWCCRECNQNKADAWPSPQDEAEGRRIIDPCELWGDHELHWNFLPDGKLESLTPVGEYTDEHLILSRAFLQQRRAQAFRDQQEFEELTTKLRGKRISAVRRAELERRLEEVQLRLEPPIFNRPHRADRPDSS